MEACEVISKVVGPEKTVRIWVPDIYEAQRPDAEEWHHLAAFLVWPVVFVGQSYRNHHGVLSIGTYNALRCTAGLVGQGLCMKHIPEGTGMVFQTMISHEHGFFFNQREDCGRSLHLVMASFAAQVECGRLIEQHSLGSGDIYSNLSLQMYKLYLKRNEHGPLLYGPLDMEEPRMKSQWRHELLSNRWQVCNHCGFNNDMSWVPMNGSRILVGSQDDVRVDPSFCGVILGTGHMQLAFLMNEHSRRLIILGDVPEDGTFRSLAYYRSPSFMGVEQALRIVWEGEASFVKSISYGR